MSGPTIVPIIKAPAYILLTLPRISAGANLAISPIAETVNMVEPIPPKARNTKSCSYD